MNHSQNSPIIIFDWDNTLINSWPIIHKALHDLFVDFDKEPWSLSEVKENVAQSMRDAFPKIFGEDWEHAGKIYQQHYRKHNLQNLVPMENAEKTLKWLQASNITTAIISNKKGDNLRNELNHIGWNDYFSAAIGAGDAEKDKPTPSPAIAALEKLELDENTPFWYVGDSAIDLEFSANTGAIPVLYGVEPLEFGVSVNENGTGEYKGFAFAHYAQTHASLLKFLQQQFIMEA